MSRIKGIGGIFMKAKDVKGLAEWYKKHLDISFNEYGYVEFLWNNKNPSEPSRTLLSLFPSTTDYLQPSSKDTMINFIVEDLVGLVGSLKEQGIETIGELQESEYGKFAWLLDPEGNKIELWEEV